MSGFVSILGNTDAAELKSMAGAVLGREMDGRGAFVSPLFSVVQHRLTTMGTDERGAQPMQADDVVVALHGCIYNYRTLKTQLEQDGITFDSDADTEIIPHLYRRFGLGMFNMLEGMFSLVLWDQREQVCLLARDTFGEKPLFVCEQSGRIGFSSSQNAFEKGNWSLTPNLNSVYQILTRRSAETPQTMYQEIAQLPAGCYALARAGQPLQIRRYFFLPEPDQPLDLEPHEIQGEVKSMLVQSIISKAVSDKPLGVLLSGDVNASLLAGVLRQDAGQDVHSFGVRFANVKKRAKDDASLYAKQVAAHLGTKHTTLDVDTTAHQALDDLSAAFDMPVTNTAALSTYLTSQAAKQHVDVLLSDVGGDEVFGGHARYLGLQWHDKWQHFPTCNLALKRLAKLGGCMFNSRESGNPSSTLRRVFEDINQPPAKAYQHWLSTTNARWSAMFGAEQQAHHASSTWHNAADVAGGLPALLANYGAANGAMLYDACTYLSDDLLATGDRMSRAHGLELRAPFLDAGLFSFVATLDASYKVKGLPWQVQLKVMLKTIASDYLPKDVVHRSKQGLMPPLNHWMQNDFKGDIQAMIADKPLGGLVRPSFVQELWDRHQKGEDKSDILWGLLLMNRWMQQRGWKF